MPVKETQEVLPRSLSVWGIWLLVVNGLIGAGIFGLPSGAALLAGIYSPWVYLICALLILPILLCFAELASYFKGTGGPIRYVTEAFGPFLGFQSGWLFYIARVISFSANSVLLVDSIAYFWPDAGSGFVRLLVLAAICGGLTFINVIGAVQSIRSLASLTVVKFLVLIALVLFGLRFIGMEHLPRFDVVPPQNLDLGAATLLLIYAFVGFESAVVPAGESRNPAKDMPRALLLGLLMVALLYVLIQLVAIAVVPNISESSSPLLDVAAVLFGQYGAAFLMIGVVASVGGNLVNAIFTTPRITYALALDKSLPSWFGSVHPSFKTPANSVMFYGLLCFLLAAFSSFIWLAAATVLSRLIMYSLSCAAMPVLRKRFDKNDTLRWPGGWLLPMLSIAACAWLMLQVSLDSILLTAGIIIAGSLLYALARHR